MSFSLSLEKYAGKVAVVTGASAGIGKAITESLVKHGVVVAAIARRTQRLIDHAAQLKGEKGTVHPYPCDLTQQDQILTTFKKIINDLGPIHILVNNAGVLLATDIIGGDIAKWKPILDTNVLAVAICIREAVENMKNHQVKGHIINVNSVLGHTPVDVSSMSLYPASKHALTALTESVRMEINREKLPIKITSLSPGYTETEIFDVAFGQMPEYLKEIKGMQAEDIAEAALYVLATPDHVNVKELIVLPQGNLF